MQCNVGRTEQVVRISAGIAIVLIGIYFRSWWGLIGLIPIITGATRFCPANKLLGINNCKPRRAPN